MESYLSSLANWVIGLVTFGVLAVLTCSFFRWRWEESKLGKWEKKHGATILRLSSEESYEE
jgi:hypothetical protein